MRPLRGGPHCSQYGAARQHARNILQTLHIVGRVRAPKGWGVGLRRCFPGATNGILQRCRGLRTLPRTHAEDPHFIHRFPPDCHLANTPLAHYLVSPSSPPLYLGFRAHERLQRNQPRTDHSDGSGGSAKAFSRRTESIDGAHRKEPFMTLEKRYGCCNGRCKQTVNTTRYCVRRQNATNPPGQEARTVPTLSIRMKQPPRVRLPGSLSIRGNGAPAPAKPLRERGDTHPCIPTPHARTRRPARRRPPIRRRIWPPPRRASCA